jgi:multiple sugar transport system substrate-binding protein
MRSMKSSRRKFLKAASLAISGSILAACAPQSQQPVGQQGSTTDPVSEVPQAEAAKITVWGWWEERMRFFDDSGKKFKDQNPNMTVEVITIAQDLWPKVFASVPAGTGPTLCKMQTTNYFKMRDQNMLIAVNEQVFRMEELKKLFPNHAWDAYGNYVLPEGNQGHVLFYNKEMYENAGLDPEKPAANWNDFLEDAKKLTQYDSNGAITVQGYQPDDWMPEVSLLYQQGQMIVKRDGGNLTSNFDTPEMANAYKFLYDAHFTQNVWDKTFPYFTESIATEKAAQSFCEAWVTGDVKANAPEVFEKMGFAAPPTPNGEPNPYYGRQNSVLGLASLVNRPTPETLAGQKFQEFLYKEDLDSQFRISDIAGLVPAHVENLQRTEVVNDPFYKLMVDLVSKEYDTVDIGGGFGDIFYKALDMLIINQDSVNTVLAFGQAELQKIIDAGEIKFTQ